jgi:hypothetical protein
MAFNMALIATIFLTRDRWAAWVPDGGLGPSDDWPRAVGPEATRAVFFTKHGDAELWDVNERKRIAMFPGSGSTLALTRVAQSSPDGARCLIRHMSDAPPDTRLLPPLLIDTVTGERTGDFEEFATPSAACFSPDGSRLFMSFEGGPARVWDARTGRVVTDLAMGGPPAAEAAFSPDGRLLLLAQWDSVVSAFDPVTGREIRRYCHDEAVARVSDDMLAEFKSCPVLGDVRSVGFSSSGERAIVERCIDELVGERTVQEKFRSCQVFDTSSGAHVATLCASYFELSPDGKRLAVTGSDDGENCLLDAEDLRVVARFGIDDPVGFGFDAGGALLHADAGGDGMDVLDAQDGHSLFSLPFYELYAISPEGKMLVLGVEPQIERLEFRDGVTGELLASIDDILYCAVLRDDLLWVTSRSDDEGKLLRRIRPERWWGVFWLPHLYVIAALASALAWSGWRDLRRLRRM